MHWMDCVLQCTAHSNILGGYINVFAFCQAEMSDHRTRFHLSFSPSDMSSSPANLTAFLHRVDAALPSYEIMFQVAADCVFQITFKHVY